MLEFKIKAAADGLELAVALCEAVGEPRGIVQIAHGMCEHKERYFEFMSYLGSKGFVSVCHDHRGHGSEAMKAGDLGYMGKGGWRALVDDTMLVTKWVRAKYPALPLTLLGHSMGSMVVRSFVKRYDDLVDKLIVCGSPSANPFSGVGAVLAGAFELFLGAKSRPKLLQAMSLGSYNKGFEKEGYPCAWVCSDQEVLEAYHKDTLCMYRFTANGFRNLFLLMGDCYAAGGWIRRNLGLPVRFISGALDPCMGSEKSFLAAVEAMRRQGYSCDYKLYPGMRHEILNETEKMGVWEDVVKFVGGE